MSWEKDFPIIPAANTEPVRDQSQPKGDVRRRASSAANASRKSLLLESAAASAELVPPGCLQRSALPACSMCGSGLGERVANVTCLQ